MASISYELDPEGIVFDPGHPLLGVIRADFGGLKGGARFGLGGNLLASSALCCYCSTLYAALEARNIIPKDIKSSAVLAKAEHGGDVFIDKIELDVRVFVEDKDREAAQECLDGLKSSPVLRSIGKGIEIVLRTALD